MTLHPGALRIDTQRRGATWTATEDRALSEPHASVSAGPVEDRVQW